MTQGIVILMALIFLLSFERLTKGFRQGTGFCR